MPSGRGSRDGPPPAPTGYSSGGGRHGGRGSADSLPRSGSSGGGGGRGSLPATQPSSGGRGETRMAADGRYYSRGEFITFFGQHEGIEAWNAARSAASAPAGPPPGMAGSAGGGRGGPSAAGGSGRGRGSGGGAGAAGAAGGRGSSLGGESSQRSAPTGIAAMCPRIRHSDLYEERWIMWPQGKLGRIVGQGGETIVQLQQSCTVSIKVPKPAKSKKQRDEEEDDDRRAVRIKGSPEGIAAAVKIINQITQKRGELLKTVTLANPIEEQAELARLLSTAPSWQEDRVRSRTAPWGEAVLASTAALLDDEESYAGKVQIARELQELLHDAGYGNATVFLFGSSVTGLAEKTADLDISCDLYGEWEWPLDSEEDEVRYIHSTFNKWQLFDGLRMVPCCRVPIVGNVPDRAQPGRGVYGAAFDLSFRLHGAVNSHLLRSYAVQHPAVRLAAVAVKSWSKSVRINNSRKGYLTSYAVVIMLIHYLLRRHPSGLVRWRNPRALQSVQGKKPKVPPLPEAVGSISPDSPGLADEVGLVLSGFWHFYAAEFDWANEVITINRSFEDPGGVRKEDVRMDRAPLVDGWQRRQYNIVCIQDPYEMSENDPSEPLNLGRHLTPQKAAEVKLAFVKAWLEFATAPAAAGADRFRQSIVEVQESAPNVGFAESGLREANSEGSDGAHDGGSDGGGRIANAGRGDEDWCAMLDDDLL